MSDEMRTKSARSTEVVSKEAWLFAPKTQCVSVSQLVVCFRAHLTIRILLVRQSQNLQVACLVCLKRLPISSGT